MGALALVQNGDDVLTNLGLGTAKYADLMRQLGILSGVYLMISLLTQTSHNLDYFPAPKGSHQCSRDLSTIDK